MSQKRCPQCKKLVDASVSVCPFCGYVFPDDHEQAEKSKKNRGCLILVGLIIAVAIALAVLTAKRTPTDAADKPATEAVITE